MKAPEKFQTRVPQVEAIQWNFDNTHFIRNYLGVTRDILKSGEAHPAFLSGGTYYGPDHGEIWSGKKWIPITRGDWVVLRNDLFEVLTHTEFKKTYTQGES